MNKFILGAFESIVSTPDINSLDGLKTFVKRCRFVIRFDVSKTTIIWIVSSFLVSTFQIVLESIAQSLSAQSSIASYLFSKF